MPRFDACLVGPRPYALLGLLCLALYLPGIAAIPVLDRDEARFAQATRQMLEIGDFLNIRFQDEARNKKPAGIYWLQAASVALFSTAESRAIWPYRLPSVLGATGAVMLTFAFGRLLGATAEDRAFPSRAAFLAAVLLATSLGVIAEAHIAKTDAALLATAVAAQGALGVAYIRGRAGESVAPWIAAVFWFAIAAAILLKGPPVPLLALVTIVTLAIADRSAAWLRGLRPGLGIVFALLVVSPWLIAMQRATEGRFLAESVGNDLLGKLVGAQEAHGAPPFYYFALLVPTFWPGSLFVAAGAVRVWQRRDLPSERFLLAWIVPAWILLELVPTKLPHYVLPLYPALALVAASAVALPEPVIGAIRAGWAARVAAGVRGLWGIATLALAALLIALPLRLGDHLSGLGVAGALLLLGLAAALLHRAPRGMAAAAGIAGLALAFAISAGWGVLPGLDRLWLSRSAAALAAEHPAQPGAPVATLGYNEPSLVFLLGAEIRPGSPKTAADAIAAGGQALVSNREEAAFRQALETRGLGATALGEVRGLNYSNGQRTALTLYDARRP